MENKEHISFWISKENLKEAEMIMKSIDSKSRSDYIDNAVAFYNGYHHNKNNEEYINKNIVDTIQGVMDSFERRMARQMFKQAVEIAKIFWLMVDGFKLTPSQVDDLHNDCVEEVKRINGAIRFPYKNKDEDG